MLSDDGSLLLNIRAKYSLFIEINSYAATGCKLKESHMQWSTDIR